MNRGVKAAAAAAIAAVLFVGLTVSSYLSGGQGAMVAGQQFRSMRAANAALTPGCVTSGGTTPPALAALNLTGIPVSDTVALANARTNATIINAVVGSHGPVAVKVSLMGAMQESHLQNLPGGDRDSKGLFQQRVMYYGPTIPVDPTLSTQAFMGPKGTVPGLAPDIKGFLDVPNWDTAAPGLVVQTVQRSAYPDAYDQWEQEAATWTAALTGSSVGTCQTCPGGRVTWGKWEVDPATDQVLRAVEAAVGKVTVEQGSWSNGSESGGTHTGSGASDFWPVNGDWQGAVRAARAAGGIAWHRTPDDGFAEHIHMIVPGIPGLSVAAQAQVVDYQNGWNGLADPHHNPDPGPPVTAVDFSALFTGTCGAGGNVAAGAWTDPEAPGSYIITAQFGSISSVRSAPHTGTDLAGPCGQPELAAAAGTVVHAGTGASWAGFYVVIDHGGGLTTWYAHQAAGSQQVTAGQPVTAGQVLGLEGSTGNSTGCHLHFETRVNDVPVDAVPFMAQRGVTL